MNCTDFERETQELLDSRRTCLPDRLGEHVAGCARCRAYWNGQLALMTAVGAWKNAFIVPLSTSAVLAELHRSQAGSFPLSRLAAVEPVRRKSGPLPGVWTALCATAALVVVSVTLVRLAPRMSSDDPAAPLAGSPAIHDSSMTVALADLWQGVHEEYQEFSHETSRILDEISELPSTSVTAPNLSSPAEFSSSDSSPSATGSDWLNLHRPVSDRVGRAFSFLKGVVPEDPARSS